MITSYTWAGMPMLGDNAIIASFLRLRRAPEAAGCEEMKGLRAEARASARRLIKVSSIRSRAERAPRCCSGVWGQCGCSLI